MDWVRSRLNESVDSAASFRRKQNSGSCPRASAARRLCDGEVDRAGGSPSLVGPPLATARSAVPQWLTGMEPPLLGQEHTRTQPITADARTVRRHLLRRAMLKHGHTAWRCWRQRHSLDGRRAPLQPRQVLRGQGERGRAAWAVWAWLLRRALLEHGHAEVAAAYRLLWHAPCCARRMRTLHIYWAQRFSRTDRFDMYLQLC